VLALFSVCGFVAEEVNRAAWDDYGEAAGGSSLSRAPMGMGRLSPHASRYRSVPWPSRQPG
jgi:hypothetical protein